MADLGPRRNPSFTVRYNSAQKRRTKETPLSRPGRKVNDTVQNYLSNNYNVDDDSIVEDGVARALKVKVLKHPSIANLATRQILNEDHWRD